MDASTREFAERGSQARKTGKTKSNKRMIYYYFGGKDGLYLKVLKPRPGSAVVFVPIALLRRT